MVIDNSLIIAPSYFKLFKCDKTFFDKIYATCEQVCMATLKERYDIEVIKYQQARISESMEKYYMELSNTIKNFNEWNNTPLSNVNIQESILRVMREDEEVAITDAKNVNADKFSHASSSKRENSNMIFTSEKLEKS